MLYISNKNYTIRNCGLIKRISHYLEDLFHKRFFSYPPLIFSKKGQRNFPPFVRVLAHPHTYTFTFTLCLSKQAKNDKRAGESIKRTRTWYYRRWRISRATSLPFCFQPLKLSGRWVKCLVF